MIVLLLIWGIYQAGVTSLLNITDVEIVHLLNGYFRVDSPLEGLRGIFSALSQDDPSATGVFDHEAGNIIDPLFDD